MTAIKNRAANAMNTGGEPCLTCSASFANDAPRVIRCGTCKVQLVGFPTNWREKSPALIRDSVLRPSAQECTV